MFTLLYLLNEKILALYVQAMAFNVVGTDKPGVPISCDWVNTARASGAPEVADDIIGNLVGLILSYWYILVIVLGILAAVTFVISKNRNRDAVRDTLVAVLVGILAIPVLSALSSVVGNGPC